MAARDGWDQRKCAVAEGGRRVGSGNKLIL